MFSVTPFIFPPHKGEGNENTSGMKHRVDHAKTG